MMQKENRMMTGHDIDRLLEIMKALRDPRTGCPWDIEQTFATIAPYTVEEAYEVADAIARDDADDLRDELGDLLLQVVYHARMAEEAGMFAFGDVVAAINTKMVRRHPHVFGDDAARSAGAAKGFWESIKAEEKRERRDRDGGKHEGLLESVTDGLPGLTRARKLQEKASTVGFDWNDWQQVIAKIREETSELEAELEARASSDRVEGEIGDLLFAVVNLARHAKVDADHGLRRTNVKFLRRFAAIEANLRAAGSSLQNATLEEMETLWVQAKSSETAAQPTD